MGKEGNIFTVPFDMNFGLLGEYGPIIVSLFLPIVYYREWIVPWRVKGRELAVGVA